MLTNYFTKINDLILNSKNNIRKNIILKYFDLYIHICYTNAVLINFRIKMVMLWVK